MSPRRLIILPAVALLLYLGIYSWNQRTGYLDGLAQNTGLEAVGAVLKSVQLVQDSITDAWSRYLDLVNVREENEQLRQRLAQFETRLILAAEEKAELTRLRALLSLQPPEGWQQLASRVLAGRMGSNAALITVTIDRGYLTGATPGAPAMSDAGVLGRVFRTGPTTATVLLLTDPGSRVAVVSQQGRVQGILAGSGPFKPLDLRFVSHNAQVAPGELLVTSGLDEAFPKGLPVARVTSAGPSDLSPFQSVQADPLANLSALEEILVLARTPGAAVSPIMPMETEVPVLPEEAPPAKADAPAKPQKVPAVSKPAPRTQQPARNQQPARTQAPRNESRQGTLQTP